MFFPYHKGETRTDRISRAFQEMFPALCFSAFTTFASVIALANSEWLYFRTYYCGFYMIVLFFAFFNGVFVQTVLLRYIGPSSIMSKQDEV